MVSALIGGLFCTGLPLADAATIKLAENNSFTYQDTLIKLENLYTYSGTESGIGKVHQHQAVPPMN